ncbi:hypothetical protein BGZ54_004440, partial [Gamsiella multidivaricata]
AEALNAWNNPDDIIYDYNIQSVITHPAHDECLDLDTDATYAVRGYAYSGSGLKVKRVQVSLDGGKSWRMAQLDHPEEKMKTVGGNRYWCWCLWTLDVPIGDFIDCKELTCRAWDINNNTQPQATTWNLTGMMHNAWYIIKTHIERTPVQSQGGGNNDASSSSHDEVLMRFQHPTVISDKDDKNAEGWMKPPRRDPSEVTTLTNKVLVDPCIARLTRQEVAKHTGPSDAWVIVHNKVYDCSAFLDEHPGGAASILSATGTDATKVFKEIHSVFTHELFGNYLLGELDEHKSSQSSDDPSPHMFLKPDWQPIRLVEKKSISHDTRLFRFALSNEQIELGLPVGKHVVLRGIAKDDRHFVRAYTPVSDNHLQGYVEFVVKIYEPNEKFPEGGHLSQLLDSLEIGKTVDVRGPLGSFSYVGRGRWQYGYLFGQAHRIVMMAGGTGITPIYQVLRAIAQDPADPTDVRLIYANRTENDILLREELTELEKGSNGRIKICLTLSEPSKDWKGCKGHIDERMIREYATFDNHDHLDHAADAIGVLCGPPGLIEKACLPNIIKVYGPEMMRV